ncbi:hypothetical protein L9F63_009191, partial [Diploptera punctata]
SQADTTRMRQQTRNGLLYGISRCSQHYTCYLTTLKANLTQFNRKLSLQMEANDKNVQLDQQEAINAIGGQKNNLNIFHLSPDSLLIQRKSMYVINMHNSQTISATNSETLDFLSYKNVFLSHLCVELGIL